MYFVLKLTIIFIDMLLCLVQAPWSPNRQYTKLSDSSKNIQFALVCSWRKRSVCLPCPEETQIIDNLLAGVNLSESEPDILWNFWTFFLNI